MSGSRTSLWFPNGRGGGFDTDALDVTLDLGRLGAIASILLLELRR
jgi:hypothetical protein